MNDAGHSNQLNQLTQRLSDFMDHPHDIALVLVAQVLDRPKSWILAHPETNLTQSQQIQLENLAARLVAGEPLPYLTGTQEFFGLSFQVNPSVLIPSPETEMLVEHGLLWLKNHPDAISVLDVGTGSGCIAVSLAVHCPRLRLVASDLSADALTTTRSNAQTHGVTDRIEFIQGNLISPSLLQFDLICANLPYIPTDKLSQVNSLPYEPALALDGGLDGLRLIQTCLQQATLHIKTPGLILLETEATLGSQTLILAHKVFPECKISLLPDLAGKDRLVRIELES